MNRDLGVWTSEDGALVLIDWAGPLGDAGREVTGWYLAEAPKLPGEVVGMALVETLRWNGQGAA